MVEVTISRVIARYRRWPRDMRRVRKSAFGSFDNQPTCLRRVDCWIVRAERGGRLVAYALAYDIGGDRSMACLDEVAVLARYQGSGVGTAVTAAAVGWIRENGIEHISCLAIDHRMARILTRLQLGAATSGSEERT
jgi:GNAT superfamily N-acetyltransferase